MAEQEEGTREWNTRLEQDGQGPPASLVRGCVALFGVSPTYVFGYRSELRWTVVAQDGDLIGKLTAVYDASAQDDEDANQLHGWALPLSQLAEIRLDADMSQEAASTRWTLKFGSGRKIRLPLRREASNEERVVAGRLVTQLRESWAMPSDEGD